MGKRGDVGKIKLNSAHIRKIFVFAKKLLNYSHIEKVEYFKAIKREELDLISEIVLNFIKCIIKHDSNSLKLLHRVKTYMYTIASKKAGVSVKKNILQSLKGLNILNIILLLVINQLQ